MDKLDSKSYVKSPGVKNSIKGGQRHSIESVEYNKLIGLHVDYLVPQEYELLHRYKSGYSCVYNINFESTLAL